MEYFTEASLSDSHMFQQLNKSSSLMTSVVKAIKNGIEIDSSYFEQQYLQIQKTKISPISEIVMKAYNDGKIKLIYNTKDHVTVALPFVIVNMKGIPTGCIFINEFSGMTKSEDPQLTIEMKRLYTLLESSHVAATFFTKPEHFKRNASFLKCMADIYSQMVMRLLNREYSLSLEKDTFDTINYQSARFFLEVVMEVTSHDIAHAYAKACCNSPGENVISIADTMYTDAKITTIEGLIHFFASTNKKMSNLTFRYFFERWVSSFGTGASLGIDSYPYFYYCIANVLLGGFLVNATALSELIKNTKGINNMYPEILRIMSL